MAYLVARKEIQGCCFPICKLGLMSFIEASPRQEHQAQQIRRPRYLISPVSECDFPCRLCRALGKYPEICSPIPSFPAHSFSTNQHIINYYVLLRLRSTTLRTSQQLPLESMEKPRYEISAPNYYMYVRYG